MQWLASAHEVWRIATRPIDCGAPASHGPPHESDVTAVKESESNPPSSTSRQLPLESQVRYQGSPPTVGAGCVYRFVDVPWMVSKVLASASPMIRGRHGRGAGGPVGQRKAGIKNKRKTLALKRAWATIPAASLPVLWRR